MLEIIVEGTVGAGKTALVEILEKEWNMKGFYEMNDELADQLLERYYADRHRWCLTMELYFLHKRFLQLQQASQIERAVMDRSMLGDFVFVRMQKHLGFLQPVEYTIYEQFYKTMSKISPQPKLLVYIKCDVKTAMRRIRKRGRPYEANVEEEYWKQLVKFYDEAFFADMKGNVLIVDGDDLDFVENEQHRTLVLEAIQKSLKTEAVRCLDSGGLRTLESWYNRV
ncbi:MAG: Deoxynucleoside kinase [Thermotoga sp. 50_1627]|uniref:deoxynucleoside kinase n=1 Tax=Pseudothermotoga sp. TaxID=2033661 RepID=UPI00076C37C1|nr:MAG: Deoxynucleoside kinase [Thermotoga sp. 50_64]KUK25644.1 MAG: Deoxynucleoside kinase [Thermotoga sp. 50_1627]MBC7115555.1 deoxynucleoside kinase [Pseudothermotoga sp.]MDK2923047.1 hypothetical protein [Pseudothermotoga sp.]HBT40027.1 deoxynucleoside kinase [Pseudothermotoga sp.]